MILFAVRDLKANLFHAPHCVPNPVDAIRGFEQAVNNAETMFAKYPDDFELVQLADFDPTTGVLSVLDRPHRLAHAVDLKSKPSDQVPMFKQ